MVIERVFAALQELNKAGVTILLVEQNALQALDLAHRVYVLERGEVAISGSAQEVRSRADFTRTYVGIG